MEKEKALKVIEKLTFASMVHTYCEKSGIEMNLTVCNALIDMYSKVFDTMPYSVRDIVTWNSIISGYLQNGLSVKALKVFGGMLRNGDVKPNEVTAVSVITACARIGSLDLGKKIHSLSVVTGFLLDVYLGSSLIDMYTKCGRTDDAKNIFDRMSERNVVCWTSMIAGYVKLDLFKQAIELFRKMQDFGLKADSATIACIAFACGHLGALDQGRWVHTYCEKSGIEMNLTVCNALIECTRSVGMLLRHSIFLLSSH